MSTSKLEFLPVALLELVPDDPTAELGAGTPNIAVEAKLGSLVLDAAFTPHKIVDRDMATACHSGLWLAHNFLDTSHILSQSIETTTGSFWHGIMHRREGDFSNAKYWFRKVGSHPIFDPLADVARDLAEELGTGAEDAFLGRQDSWDPMAFIDLCESVSRGSDDREVLAAHIARQEWELLMQYSFQEAVAG